MSEPTIGSTSVNETKRRILIVDDEPVIRLFLQELFEDEGYAVVTAQSIAEGIAALKVGRFNLVVTDKNLPDGTGFEIVHASKACDPPCEAMIITGYASLDSAVMALQIGAYDYVLKPIEDVDLLLEKARKAIEKQDLWVELQGLRKRLKQSEESTAAHSLPTATVESPLAAVASDVPQLMKLAELGSLIPMLAHEMRQPLAGIKGYVDLLLHKKELDPNVRTRLQSVQEQVVHVSGLVDSLTTYSRISAAGATPVDLNRPVTLALSIFPVLRGGRYDLSVEVPEDLPLLRGNANALQQVIVNLLKNAKDALDEAGGGSLRISARHDEQAGQLRLRVEDTGPGISPATRERLFDPFFTTKQEGVGTGLGLTICKQIVTEHGGRIEVESPLSPAGGTAFTLVFPVAHDAEPAVVGARR